MKNELISVLNFKFMNVLKIHTELTKIIVKS